MHRHWILNAVFALAAVAITLSEPASAQERYAAVVIDATSGDVLYEDKADERRFPASLAKMMTLYLLFEAIRHNEIRRDDTMIASTTAATQPASHLGLQEGDRITVEDAILALCVRSANDVATVIAERLGGNEENFAALMTARARALGLTNTRFVNASGLPDPTQSTTARDMARLGRALWTDFPEFYGYFQTADFTWDNLRVRNHNHLLSEVDGVDGIKTGYTRASGFNIASSAQRNGRRVFVVVMGSGSAAARDAQAAYLINSTFDQYTRRAEMSTATAALRTASQRSR